MAEVTAASLEAADGDAEVSVGVLSGAAGASLVAAGAASSAFFWHADSAIDAEATKRNIVVFFIGYSSQVLKDQDWLSG